MAAKFFTGVACKTCGNRQRYASNRGCIVCAMRSSDKSYRKRKRREERRAKFDFLN